MEVNIWLFLFIEKLRFMFIVNLFARFTVTAFAPLEVGYRLDKVFLGKIGPIF